MRVMAEDERTVSSGATTEKLQPEQQLETNNGEHQRSWNSSLCLFEGNTSVVSVCWC